MASRRLPRASAFAEHGVILSDPERSMSGVSTRDGAIVLAMKAGDIHIGDDGCSCLLWALAMPWSDAGSKGERRQHCELAMLRGAADGLLDHGGARGSDPDESVSLRVVGICGEYWAKWGAAVRLRTAVPARFALPAAEEARCAALAA